MHSAKIYCLLFFLFFFILLSTTAYADPIINYPGTRARAMGGAFTAVADDASAIWYNPAGLAVVGTKGSAYDFILEGSQTIDVNKLDVGNFEPFIAFKGSKDAIGFALAYYVPYTYADISFYPEKMQLWSLGLARSFGPVKIGGTVEYAVLNYKSPASNESDVTGSVGVQITPVVYDPWGLQVRFGGVYRFSSSATKHHIGYFDKPSSWNAGMAIFKSITDLNSNIVLAGQYELSDWTDTVINDEYKMVSYGIEWQLVLDHKISHIAFRAGHYKEEPSESNNDFEIKGLTYGIGIKFSKIWAISYTLEDRKWTSLTTDKDFKLHSVALTAAY